MTCKGKGDFIRMDRRGILCLSFYIYPNESHERRGGTNVCEFSVFYNTKKRICGGLSRG